MIKKNGLTLKMAADGSFTCADLVQLPQTFAERNSADEVQKAIDEYVGFLRGMATAGGYASKEECDAVPEAERNALGQERFDAVIADLKSKTTDLNLFQTFLFWFGYWVFYHPTIMQGVRFNGEGIYDTRKKNLKRFLMSALPQSVQSVVQGMEFANVATEYGHFALLFLDNERQVRRIVTDTQLFELRGVRGYVYLDITPDGKPIARSVCERGGGRAFFDGVRLMSHERFETCAPKTVIVDGGYKVNSTRCTIVNGKLFELIDADDKVAHTTGAFFGICDFTREDMVAAFELAEQSGKLMKISGDRITLGDRELKSIGLFAPSKITLLDSGFALYDWSDFHEILSLRYDHILVVDDKQEWIKAVTAEFTNEAPKLESFQTTVANDALQRIVESNPQAVLLDMHLTEEERFDGLWIANQLAARGFEGAVLIASNYGPDALQAMQKLIKLRTVPTGKDLKKVRLALCGKPVA